MHQLMKLFFRLYFFNIKPISQSHGHGALRFRYNLNYEISSCVYQKLELINYFINNFVILQHCYLIENQTLSRHISTQLIYIIACYKKSKSASTCLSRFQFPLCSTKFSVDFLYSILTLKLNYFIF